MVFMLNDPPCCQVQLFNKASLLGNSPRTTCFGTSSSGRDPTIVTILKELDLWKIWDGCIRNRLGKKWRVICCLLHRCIRNWLGNDWRRQFWDSCFRNRLGNDWRKQIWDGCIRNRLGKKWRVICRLLHRCIRNRLGNDWRRQIWDGCIQKDRKSVV